MRRNRTLSLLLSLMMLFSFCSALMLPEKAAALPSADASVSISGSEYVAVGKTIRLTAAVTPADADRGVTWKSSDRKIATVTSAGKVKGVKAGKVKITATSKADKNLKGTFTVTVKAKAVKSIKITAPATTLYLKGTKAVQLTAKASPSSAAQSFTWKSSDKKVARVSKTGKVTAVGTGKAVITAAATDGSGVKKTVAITVKKSNKPEPKYYALLIGNGSGYWGLSKLTGVANDVKGMNNALKGQSRKWQITVKENLGAEQMKRAIKTAFAGATVDDVCLFYYSGHGSEATDGTAGALCGIDADLFYEPIGIVYPTELRDCLTEATPGKVIVLLDSCGSGAAIYSENGGGNPKSFTSAIARAFSGPTIKVESNTGELLDESKFAVLAACAYGTTSMGGYVTQKLLDDYLAGYPEDGELMKDGSAFTYALVRAMGFSYPGTGRIESSADTNKDGKLTLKEAYAGVKNSLNYMDKIWREFVAAYDKLSGEDNSDALDFFAQATQMSGTPGTVLCLLDK